LVISVTTILHGVMTLYGSSYTILYIRSWLLQFRFYLRVGWNNSILCVFG